MEEQKYEFELGRDDRGRLQAQICEGIKCSIKVLPLDDEKRVSKGTHAYVVMHLDTALGVFVRRNIRIQHSTKSGNFFLRYEQFPTERKTGSGEAVEEWLDVFGPKGKSTRNKVQELILRMFEEIKERGETGKLPALIPRNRRNSSSSPSPTPRTEVHAGAISDRPEVVAQLETVRENLQAGASEEVVPEVVPVLELVAEIEVSAEVSSIEPAPAIEHAPFDPNELLLSVKRTD
jgi:DNA-binding cell septation regulator SpoVG